MSDTLTTAAQTADPPTTETNGKRRRILSIIAIIVLVLAIAWVLLEVLVWSKREKTDDAYVTGNQVRVSAQVPGNVVEILALSTSRVSAGQKLLLLDSTDAQQGLDHAAATLAQTVRQVRQQQAQSGQFDGQIASRVLELRTAEADLAQREPLQAELAVSGEEVRHARDAVELARAGLLQTRHQAQAARALVDRVPLERNPAVLAARAAYMQAWLALQRTTVHAPIGGIVAMRSVQLGQRVATGEPLMSIIPLQDVWIEANFKEGQLRNLRIGQTVRIRTDIYGADVNYHGKILGLSAGTGAAFSLLPAQNASGNWIKVVQRVPVKIALDPEEVAAHPLRVGLSTTATVDTHDRGGEVLASEPATDVHESTSAYTQDMAAAQVAADQIIRDNAS